MVIKELHAIQEKHGYVPEKELYDLAQRLSIPVYDLHGVATFYPHFRMVPPPKVDVRVCGDFPCALNGCDKLRTDIEALCKGRTDVHVGHVSCLGQCDRAPGILINDHPYAGQGHAALLELVKTALAGKEVPEQHFPGLKGPFKTDPYETEAERYGAVKTLVNALLHPPPKSEEQEAVEAAVKSVAAAGPIADIIAKLKTGGLRGMGGAGFPTGAKWEAVNKAPGDEKYVVCNADECEVATFKDRELMKNVPWLLVEGMVLAGLVTGAKRGFVYIRHEYHDQIHSIEHEIEKAKKLGIVGKNVLGSGRTFDLEVFVSPGGYIQGEESALLEAIEGHRGQPRVKPPFPVFVGLWGKPTVINNVETLCYVPSIVHKGPDWFKGQGVKGCNGLKWIGVSGHVNTPGVFEVPMGTTYDDAINKLGGGVSGGRKLKAFAPSGPSGGFLPPSMLHLSMDFKIMQDAGSMLGSGAIVAIAEGTDMVEMALNATRFYRNESCGKCVPCRIGSQKMVDIIYKISAGKGTKADLDDIAQLSDTLVMTSICGLGQVVPAPIESVLKYFKNEIDAKIKQ